VFPKFGEAVTGDLHCFPHRAVFCDDADEFKPILALFAKKKIYPGEEIT
jgi:hypothetical protein